MTAPTLPPIQAQEVEAWLLHHMGDCSSFAATLASLNELIGAVAPTLEDSP